MNKEKIINTKEKMIRNCNFASKFILGLEILMLIGPVLLLIAVLGTGFVIRGAAVENEQILIENSYEVGEDFYEVNEENQDVTENLVYEDENAYENYIYAVASYIAILINLEFIRRILKNTVKKETPFLKENLDEMKKIDICIGIRAFIGIFTVSTMSVFLQECFYMIFLSCIYLVFKYGYEIQKESAVIL